MKTKSKKDLIILSNTLGMQVSIAPFGAGIYDICLPNKDGTTTSIVVRPKTYEQYERSASYFGKTLGPNSGRLSNSTLTLNEVDYVIQSPSEDALHGGVKGFPYQLFDVIKHEANKEVTLQLKVGHLEDGFPGKRIINIRYVLETNENKLNIYYDATSEQDTVMNLSNHVYFNLNGKGSILDHELMIDASKYVEVDSKIFGLAVKDVDDVMDFRAPKKIGAHVHTRRLVDVAGGYDHPFLLNNEQGKVIASLSNDDFQVNIYTSYPTLVFYSGNYLPDVEIESGEVNQYEMVALEPQFLPNAINKPLGQKQTGLLKADEKYSEYISFEFLTKGDA